MRPRGRRCLPTLKGGGSQASPTGSGDFSIAASDAARTATREDFEGGLLLEGLLQFDAGVASTPLIIYVHGDTASEPDEGFTVTLANASGAAHIVGSTAAGTIRNDDAGQIGLGDFGVAAEAAVKDELNSGPTFFNFTVARSGDASSFTTIDYSTAQQLARHASAAERPCARLRQRSERKQPSPPFPEDHPPGRGA